MQVLAEFSVMIQNLVLDFYNTFCLKLDENKVICGQPVLYLYAVLSGKCPNSVESWRGVYIVPSHVIKQLGSSQFSYLYRQIFMLRQIKKEPSIPWHFKEGGPNIQTPLYTLLWYSYKFVYILSETLFIAFNISLIRAKQPCLFEV